MLTPRWRTIAAWTITLAITAIALYGACRGIRWGAFWETLHRARLGEIVAAVALTAVALTLRGLRWRILVINDPPVPAVTVLWASAIGYLGNNYLPARAGEFIRGAMLARRAGLSISFVLATALTERLTDAVALAAIATVALTAQRELPDWLRVAAHVMGGLALGGGLFLAMATRGQQAIQRVLGRLPLPEHARARLQWIAGQFLTGTRSIHHLPRAAGFAAMTALIWLTDGCIALVVARALALSLSQALILVAALGLSSAVPSTPGALGVYQFTAVTVLPLFGIARDAALAYIVTFQSILYVVITLFGLLGLWQLGLPLRQMRAAPAPVADDD